MNATSLYVSTCRLVLQANPENPNCWADLYKLIPFLRQTLSCTVCGNLLLEPYTPTETICQHHVCRSCKGGKKKLKPSCSWCKNYEQYVENVQLRILLQCYKKLCEYITSTTIYKIMCKNLSSSSDPNIANITDLIHEGAGFKDEYKSTTGLSKSTYSILPCVYTSSSTQTVTQAISLANENELIVNNEDDNFLVKSNLSNGCSLYSVMYAGSGNKMVIKRKSPKTNSDIEEPEPIRIIKQSNFKKPVHKKSNFRNRMRMDRIVMTEDRSNVVKKSKLGCRCGNATLSPGKLTCCGQRCPCYVVSKACLDCRCRGCRNPHTKEGQKILREIVDSSGDKKFHSSSNDMTKLSKVYNENSESSHTVGNHQLLKLRSDTSSHNNY